MAKRMRKLLRRKTYLSNAERSRIGTLHDASIRNHLTPYKYLSVTGEWHGPPAWVMRKNWSSANPFFWSYWAAHGRLEVPWNVEAREAMTFGGSCWDGMQALKAFDRPDYRTPRPTQRFNEDFRAFIGISRGCVTPLHPKDFSMFCDAKPDTNPGPTFKAMGINKKADTYAICVDWLDRLLKGELEIESIPPIMTGIGGRGKPTNVDKVIEKIGQRKACGRPVSMKDTHDPVFSWRYQNPMTRFFIDLGGVIDIDSSNSSSDRRADIKAQLDIGGFHIGGDWETFDGNVQSDEIKDAFDDIEYMFDIKPGSIDQRILKLLYSSMVYTVYVCPDRVVRKKYTGIGSGSGLTIIIDSLVNARRLYRLSKKYTSVIDPSSKMEKLKVCGDDNLQSWSTTGSFKLRWKKSCQWVDFVHKYGTKYYHAPFSVTKTRKSVYPYVSYRVPKTLEYVADHSRRYLRETEMYRTRPDGSSIPLKDGEKYTILRDWRDVEINMEVCTKRFEYSFSGAIAYCSAYYLPSGQKIRPKRTIISRLGSTSTPIKTVTQWRTLITQYMVEFWSNLSARAELFSMWLDSFQMETLGIISSEDALNNVYSLEAGDYSYPARTYILENYGTRVSDPRCLGRQYWMARGAWWPTADDAVSLGVRVNYRALVELAERLNADAGFRGMDLFRLRDAVGKNRLNVLFADEKKRDMDKILRLYQDSSRCVLSTPSYYSHIWDLTPASVAISDSLLSFRYRPWDRGRPPPIYRHTFSLPLGELPIFAGISKKRRRDDIPSSFTFSV